MKTISVLNNFSEFPALRHCNISEKSGEEFYHTVLNKEFKEQFEKGEKLTVNLDKTAGYASSFLDEAFGNLVFDFTLDNVQRHIEIISMQERHWKNMIEEETWLQWEERRKTRKNPKVTKTVKSNFCNSIRAFQICEFEATRRCTRCGNRPTAFAHN